MKGHDGDEWNDVADRLAVEAAETQQSRSGTGRPDALGPADGVDFGTSSASALDAMADEVGEVQGVAGSGWRPSGRSVVILGLQPPGLGGYEENDTAADVRRRLEEILRAKQALDPDLTVLSGLRLGAETLGAEAAIAAGVPLVAVLPYPDPDAKWPSTARRRFTELAERAHVVVQLERRVPDSPQRAGQAMDRRNGWLRLVADEAVIVWDRRERRVGDLARAFEKDMPDDVWILDT